MLGAGGAIQLITRKGVCVCFSVGTLALGQRKAQYHLVLLTNFTGGSDGKESVCNAGGSGFNPWVEKVPWRRAWQPIPVLLPEESHG